MKRALLLLVVVAALVVAAWYFLVPRGASEGAELVPADSVLYFTLPDMQRTIERWPKTALARIAAEPTVAEFFQKPIGHLATGGGLEAMDILLRVKPGRLFIAVPAIRENGGHVLLGFQFFGGRKDVDAAMERLYREVGKNFPDAARTTADYQGDTVTTFSAGQPMLCSAAHGSWAFIANDEAVLKQALDRAAGRSSGPSLAGSDEFKAVASHLSKAPDFLWFAKMQPVVDLLAEIGRQQQATQDMRQFDDLKKIKALGGTLLFEGENQREVSFILSPDAPKLPQLARTGMALTAPDTSAFFTSALDLQTVASDAYRQSLPPEVQDFLVRANVDLGQLPEIFGTDLSLVLKWPAGAMIPAVFAAVDVKDRPRAESLVRSIFTAFELPATPAESHGASVFPLPALPIQLVDPKIAVNDKYLFASLTTAELDRVLTLQPGAPTLEGSEAFKPALAAYKGDGQAFGFVNTKATFENIYNLIRPVVMLSTMMAPNPYIDGQKMPDTETISKHLSPILYTSRQTADGMVIESSGPVTLSQAAVIVVGGAAAASFSQLANSLGR